MDTILGKLQDRVTALKYQELPQASIWQELCDVIEDLIYEIDDIKEKQE